MRSVVLDTETTGMPVTDGHRIIEIGCVELEGRRLTGRHFHVYLQPDREVDEGAIAVHGITNEYLKDKPRFREVANDFFEFIRGAQLIILTYMLQSKDKDTGNPLSVIPEYTLNSTLDWQASERLSTQLTSTIYGRQEPPKHGTSRNTPVVSRKEVGTYGIWGVSAGYTFSENLSVRGGVSNLFDKRLYRQGNSFDAGAATYNEPGRAYYVSMTTSF